MFNSFYVQRVKNGYQVSLGSTSEDNDYVFESLPKLKKAIKEVLSTWDKKLETPRNDDSVPF